MLDVNLYMDFRLPIEPYFGRFNPFS